MFAKDKLVRSDSRSRKAQLELNGANMLRDKGDIDGAIAQYAKVYVQAKELAAVPYARALHRRCVSEERSSDFRSALSDCELALEVVPEASLKQELLAVQADLIEKYGPLPAQHLRCLSCQYYLRQEYKVCPRCNSSISPHPGKMSRWAYALMVMLTMATIAVVLDWVISSRTRPDSGLSPNTPLTPSVSNAGPLAVSQTQTAVADEVHTDEHITAQRMDDAARTRTEPPVEPQIFNGLLTPGKGTVEIHPSVVRDVRNFMVQVQFSNPSTTLWDYGVILQRSSGVTYSFYLTSEAQWYLLNNGKAESITKLPATSDLAPDPKSPDPIVYTGPNEASKITQETVSCKDSESKLLLNCNELKLYVISDTAMLFINTNWVENIKLHREPPVSNVTTPLSTDISIGAGFQTQNNADTDGAVGIRIEYFKVWRLPDELDITISAPEP